MKRAMMGALAILALTSCGQSKVLNENRSKGLIEEALQTERYVASVASLDQLMSPSRTDILSNSPTAGPASTLRRLVDQKLARQVVRVVGGYPVVSGRWVSHKGGPVSFTLQIHMAENSNELTVSCEYRDDEKVRQGSTTGIVSPRGEVKFVAVVGESSGWCFPGGAVAGQLRQIPFQYSENGTAASLTPTTSEAGGWVFTGVSSGKTIDVKWYEYALSPDAGVTPQGVVAGRFVVGAVSNLQLVGETNARADFTWSVVLNDLGRIVTGDATPSGSGTAAFVKKPDGTWVLVKPVRP